MEETWVPRENYCSATNDWCDLDHLDDLQQTFFALIENPIQIMASVGHNLKSDHMVKCLRN
jgi:hypothetical protein